MAVDVDLDELAGADVDRGFAVEPVLSQSIEVLIGSVCFGFFIDRPP
jgi:hypothetical protein